LADYLAFYKKHPSVLAEFKIDHNEALRSMRLLSLCSACNSCDGVLSYATAATAMGLQQDNEDDQNKVGAAVEEWVMLAIKNGLVDVKMCQQTHKITVFSSTQRNFQPEQWVEMKKKLTKWKQQVNKLLISTVKSIKAARSRSQQPRALR
jgi:hypothetical protein